MKISPMAQSSEEVELDANDKRAHLAHTLDQLRENLKPENVVDEVMTNAKFGAANLADGLWQAARNNPIPALLIGAGLALVLGLGTLRRNSRSRSDQGLGAALPPGGLPRATSETSPPRVEPALPVAASAAAASAAAMGDRGVNLNAPLSDRWQGDQSAIGQGWVDAALSQVPQPDPDRSVARARPSLSTLIETQPLILGAAGLAIGAAIGAAFPTTRTEEAWLGETSASLKSAAREAAKAQLSELRQAAGQAVEQVKQSVSDHGLSADNVNDLVRDLGGHAKAAMHDFGDRFEPAKRAS